ncbi:MAG: hypothetical protein RIC87_03270 [Kiloniellales bacterium]
MAEPVRRNPLLPWFIGIAIVGIIDAYIGYLFYSTECQAPGIAQVMVLIILPGVYLALMYLTLKRQRNVP